MYNELNVAMGYLKQGWEESYNTNYADVVCSTQVESQIAINSDSKELVANLLSRIGVYDETRKRTTLIIETPPVLDLYKAQSILGEFYDMIPRPQDRIVQCMRNVIVEADIVTGADDFYKALFGRYGVKISGGLKFTKAIGKLKGYVHAERHSRFDVYMEELSKCLYPKPTKREVHISWGYADFLRMSYGNSWGSCHGLDGGCYHAGTTSLAMDKVSFLLYEENNDEKLKWRMLCHVDESRDGKLRIAMNKIYGGLPREEADKIMESLAETLGKLLECETDTGKYEWRPKYKSFDYMGYRDFEYDACRIINLNTPFAFPDDTFGVGVASLCISCGYQVSDSNKLLCDDCVDSPVECYCCGDRIADHESQYEINGHIYCGNCVYVCSACGELMLENDAVYTASGSTICPTCYHDDYGYCPDCCEIYPLSEMSVFKGELYCESCHDYKVEQFGDDTTDDEDEGVSL